MKSAIRKNILRSVSAALLMLLTLSAYGQIGQHRSRFSIGGNGGWILSSVGFDPTVSQKMHSGPTFGFSWRYTSEKYFSTICSIAGEVNFASLGWTEDLLDAIDQPVMGDRGNNEEYSRTITYVQIPVFAHLAWGKESRGLNFFVNAGPQLGIYLGESTSKNYDNPNLSEDGGRSNKVTEQESMDVEKKLDYGIAAGLGLEYSTKAKHHFLLEGRYYYGLGNIYGSSKRDYFGKSNFGNIVIKLSYLFDLQ